MQGTLKRFVALDTETTGMRLEDDNRIISIGCVEIMGRELTKKEFYVLINPEREVEEGAEIVHGFTWEKLRNKPLFVDVVDDFLNFIKGSELLIHNAPYDVGFLDMELARIGRGKLSDFCESITDTLVMAKEIRPGQRAGLDALCSAYGVDNSDRRLHGALLDAQLLAKVYLAMTRGQDSLDIATVESAATLPPMPSVEHLPYIMAKEDEVMAHTATLAAIDKESKGSLIWKDGDALAKEA